MILALLALVSATFHPTAPTVGDPITVQFSSAVVLDRSADYEVISHDGPRVIVRTFAPKPFVITGTAGGERFRTTIPVKSVLRPDDPMQPAPLAAPRAVPYPREPFIAIAIAALLAAAAWVALAIRARVRPQPVAVPLSPDERFRRAILALRGDAAHPRRWAALADETRAWLAATRTHLGSELTTTELLPRLQEHERVVEQILRQGDLEKFSPRGAETRDFESVAAEAERLARTPPPGDAA